MEKQQARHSRFLLNNIWNQPAYYEKCHQHNEAITGKPWFKKIKRYCRQAKSILDIGCGEGTNLKNLASPTAEKYGIDISDFAIELAKKQYPNFHLQQANATALPFSNNNFDCVYSFATIEHIDNPQKAIDEMIRVTKRDGIFIVFTVNFGSPFFRSPADNRSFPRTLAQTLCRDLIYLIKPPRRLSWRNVIPPVISIEDYTSDRDIVNEPYLYSLLCYLQRKDINIIEATSDWESTADEIFRTYIKNSIKLLRKTGILSIYPFKYWGRLLLVVARKK